MTPREQGPGPIGFDRGHIHHEVDVHGHEVTRRLK